MIPKGVHFGPKSNIKRIKELEEIILFRKNNKNNQENGKRENERRIFKDN